MPMKKIVNQARSSPSKQQIEVLGELETPTQKILSQTPQRHQTSKAKMDFVIEQQNEELTCQFDNSETQKMNDAVDKLFAKNKISSKNAFQVPIIDVKALRSINEDGEGSWNKVSNTLGNSTKIYGFRVDFLIDNAAKMTSCIQRSERAQQLTEQREEQRIKLEQIKMTHSPANYYKFLQTQTNKLNLNSVQIRSNPITQQIRRKFDQNGINGLLINQIPISAELRLEIHPPHHLSHPQSFSMSQIPIDYPFEKVKVESISINNQIRELREMIFNPNPYNMILMDVEDFNMSLQIPDLEGFQLSDFLVPKQQCLTELIPEQGWRDVILIDEHSENDDYSCSITQKSLRVDLSKSPALKKTQKNGKGGIKKQKTHKNNKKERKPKKVRQIQFQNGCHADRHDVLTVSVADLVRKTTSQTLRYKQKNLTSTMFPPTSIHEDNLTNFNEFSIQLNSFVAQENCIQEINLIEEPIFPNDVTSRMNVSDLNHTLHRPANIKQTKQRILCLIEQQEERDQMDFDYIYETYRQNGNSSEAICFLSILHLCNENNFEISQTSLTNFKVIKPITNNFIQIEE